jgi:hypothetical protein
MPIASVRSGQQPEWNDQPAWRQIPSATRGRSTRPSHKRHVGGELHALRNLLSAWRKIFNRDSWFEFGGEVICRLLVIVSLH